MLWLFFFAPAAKPGGNPALCALYGPIEREKGT